MKKKLFSALAIAIVLTIVVTVLVACNPFKQWNVIGGGDPTAEVESNGGYFVKQGNYVYFVNGYVGTATDGTTTQQLCRAQLNEDGTVNNATTTVLAPTHIYSSAKNGGIAIFGEWIYFATPNLDKDKNGNASTTDMDFMRVKIDGSVPQVIGTIESRSAEYIFTPTRVLYYVNSTINYIDFSGMSTDKSTENGKGAKSGVIAESVAKVVWKYGCDQMVYVQNITGTDSYKNYNNLVARNLDGSNERILATQDTFLEEGEEAVNSPLKVFKFTLLDTYVESDGSLSVYYTKTHTVDGSAKTDGLFVAKVDDVKGTEKKLNTIGSTALFPLGYADGALAYNANSVYCWYNGENAENPNQVTTSSQTVWAVDAQAGVAYFTSTSSASALFKISYKQKIDNATIVLSEGIKTDWFVLDFNGADLYFFASDDSNFLHTINVNTFDKDAEDAQSTYIGFEREDEEEE